MLRQFFTDYHGQDNVAMNTIMKKNKTIFAGLTLKIVQGMTAEQKAHFVITTNDYIRMFDELVKEH